MGYEGWRRPGQRAATRSSPGRAADPSWRAHSNKAAEPGKPGKSSKPSRMVLCGKRACGRGRGCGRGGGREDNRAHTTARTAHTHALHNSTCRGWTLSVTPCVYRLPQLGLPSNSCPPVCQWTDGGPSRRTLTRVTTPAKRKLQGYKIPLLESARPLTLDRALAT